MADQQSSPSQTSADGLDAHQTTQEHTQTAIAEPAIAHPEDLDLGCQVDLAGFSGPLDLLLHLVRKSEVDIIDIPISTIADQFVAAIADWEHTDLEFAGDFILMAATLLEIKARSIMPRTDDDDEDDEDDWIDPRADLVRQLLAFRKTKDAVHWLEHLEEQRPHLHRRSFQEHIPEDPAEADGVDLDNADPYKLYAAWEKVLESIAGNRPRTVLYDDIPIEERVRKIEQVLSTTREAQLQWLLAQEDKPISRVGVIVATLEGLRKRVMEAAQHEQYGTVHLHYLDPERRAWTELEQQALVEEESQPRRRRRRQPLVTWHPPQQEGDDDGDDHEADDLEDLEEEVVVESDEQRFLRELNEHCDIDNLLQRARNLDQHLQQHLVSEGIIEALEPSPEEEKSAVTTESP
ncbi:MAG: hypothetical protein EA401_02020 [Planctomycetota bacterium]|nr:MAG: hypothetical protein EA401_02020 [Planctomycetota bacterium]